MTEAERTAEEMLLVKRYSESCEEVSLLVCRLRRFGETLHVLGQRLENDPLSVVPQEWIFDDGEPLRSLKALQEARAAQTKAANTLVRIGLGGLVSKVEGEDA